MKSYCPILFQCHDLQEWQHLRCEQKNFKPLVPEEYFERLHKCLKQLDRWALCLLYIYLRKRHSCIVRSLIKWFAQQEFCCEKKLWGWLKDRIEGNTFNVRLDQYDIHIWNIAFILFVVCLESSGTSDRILDTWERMKGRIVLFKEWQKGREDRGT